MALSFCGKQLLLTRSSFVRSIRRNGYIVLVPEIGEELPEKNPLLQQNGLPEFNNLTIENCIAAIGKQTLDFEQGVKEIEQSITLKAKVNPFEDIVEPLERIGASLDTTWGLSKALYMGNKCLMPTKSYMAIHERSKRSRANKFNSLLIYNVCKDEALNADKNRSEEQRRVIEKFVLEGKLNGLRLDASKRLALNDNGNKLAIEQSKFKGKTETATKKFIENVQDWDVVSDFPETVLKSIAADPSKPTEGPWRFRLHPSVSDTILEHCPDREMRWNVWQAVVNRGSGYADRQLETSTHLEGIRQLRRDRAKILGFETYATMSMETKMARSTDEIHEILALLLESAKPIQDEEIAALAAFCEERGFKQKLQLWDLPYWKRQQLKTLYDYTDDSCKEYFPFPRVLQGLFELTERLFDVKIKQRNGTSTWHRDVKYYEIFEDDTPVAGFYLDPYARTDEEKIKLQGHNGWMVGVQNRSRFANTKPIAALVFNFQTPAADKPSLLTLREVTVLFQKFGHSLQHMMTRSGYSEVSGLSNIEWDAVDVCGHVMSYWLHDARTLRSISGRYDNDEKLPDETIRTLDSVRRHMAGTALCEQLYLSALDLELHTSKDFWLDVVKRLWGQYRTLPLDRLDSHPCNFTEIFCDEWGAAYYSHVWSRVIAADVYGAFYEARDNEPQVLDVGKRFRDTYLALGGSCHPGRVFRKFRGRDPSPKALLSSLGLQKVVDSQNVHNKTV